MKTQQTREKLIKLLDEANQKGNIIGTADIADYLLDSGEVFVQPCKVGDKLYVISDSRIIECICNEIIIRDGLAISVHFNCDYNCKGCPFNCWKHDSYTGEYFCKGEYGSDCLFSWSDIGKIVFLTIEEAEKTLKERALNENL